MLLGAAGGMFAEAKIPLPYDAEVEYIYADPNIGGNSVDVIINTGYTSSGMDTVIESRCGVSQASYGNILGSQWRDMGNALNIVDLFSNCCRLQIGVSYAEDDFDINFPMPDTTTVQVDLRDACVRYGGQSYTTPDVRAMQLLSPLYVFASNSGVPNANFPDGGPATAGDNGYAHGIRLYDLKIKKYVGGILTLVHDFMPVKVATLDMLDEPTMTGALYDRKNPGGGPRENGLYLPMNYRSGIYPAILGYGPDVT